MNRNPNWFHKFLLRWIFKLVVKQGHNSGIREIYRALYVAHQREFTEDCNESIAIFMHDVLTNAIAYEDNEAKIRGTEFMIEVAKNFQKKYFN